MATNELFVERKMGIIAIKKRIKHNLSKAHAIINDFKTKLYESMDVSLQQYTHSNTKYIIENILQHSNHTYIIQHYHKLCDHWVHLHITLDVLFFVCTIVRDFRTNNNITKNNITNIIHQTSIFGKVALLKTYKNSSEMSVKKLIYQIINYQQDGEHH